MLAALFVRQRTGRGQRIETSLLRGVLALQSGIAIDYPGKPTLIRENPTYRLYQGSDGQWFFVACGNQSFWVKLCTALEHAGLRRRPALRLLAAADPEQRGLCCRSSRSASARSRARSGSRSWPPTTFPAAPVKTIQEFMNDPAVRHHDMVHEYDHPDVGRLRVMGQPLAFAGTPTRDPGPPPTLGQHTDAGAARARLRRHRRERSARQEGGPVSTYEAILYAAADGVATITLNRPAVHNAMNEAMRRDLMQCFEGLATDDDVRVIVVTGGGDKAFSAGADIREFTAPQVPTIFRENRRRLDFRRAMDGCWQPIIAAIRGHCFGGGLELALACDIRIASADSRLGLTEVDLAIIPGGGGTQRLPRVVGRGKALEMILTAARIDAAEALRIGLIERMVPAGEALKAAQELARHAGGQGAGGAALRQGGRDQRPRAAAGRRRAPGERPGHAAAHDGRSLRGRQGVPGEAQAALAGPLTREPDAVFVLRPTLALPAGRLPQER